MFFWEERELGACPAVRGRLELLSGQGRRSLGGQVEAAGTGRQKPVQIFSLDLHDQVVFFIFGMNSVETERVGGSVGVV